MKPLFVLWVVAAWQAPAHAEDELPPPDISDPDVTQPDTSQEALPDIEAKIRSLKVVKASTSGRVYLVALSDEGEVSAQTPEAQEKPAERKILLLRSGEENIMALRVLRDVSGTSQAIVKKIKQYGDHEALEVGQDYYALEKVSDVVPPPPTPEDKADMAEVEPAPLAFDPELDTGSSPSPNGSEDDEQGTNGSLEDRLGASIEEKAVPFERHRNWISAAFGLVRNTPDADAMNAKYYMAGGIRYGYDLTRRLFVTRDERLDTFTIEGSLFFYSISGLDASSATATSATSTGTDTYSIAPIAATGRYTYYFNEDFGLFAYGGLMKNVVMSSQNSNADRVANLGRIAPAIGAGALLRVGPQWYTRVDAGLDMIAANLMIRF